MNQNVMSQYAMSRNSQLQQQAEWGKASGDTDKLKEVCEDFESLFVKQMLDSMRKTVHKTSLMGGNGYGQEYFEDKLYEEYAKSISKTADLGIAKMMYKQLSQYN